MSNGILLPIFAAVRWIPYFSSMIMLPASAIEQLGKVFLNIGQGLILAAIVRMILQHDSNFFDSSIAYCMGMYTVGVGLFFYSAGHDNDGRF